MAQLNWLHLSDLHRGLVEQRHLWPNIEEQVFQDLRRMHAVSGPWHILFFSGDLVQTGTPQEFRLVEATLRRLYETLNALGSDPVFITIPGNHDVKRPSLTPDLTRLLTYNTDAKVRAEFWSQRRSPLRQVVKTAFSAYRSWSKSHPFPKPTELKLGELPGDFSAVVQFDEIRVGIVGLNSSFLQISGGDFREKLALSHSQLLHVCGDSYVDWLNKNTCNFLVTHHPPSWLTPAARQILDQDIAPPGRFLAHLCGHLHDGAQISTVQGGSAPRRILQSAALFGLDYFGDAPTQHERKHGYAVGQLDVGSGTSGDLTIWPRAAVRHQAGHWHFVHDPSATLEEAGNTRPETVAVNAIPATVKTKRSFQVLLLSTQEDLGGALQNIGDHLRKSLGVEIINTEEDERAADISVLLQAWMWDNGVKANEWKKSKAKNKLSFLVDESADWPPRRLVDFQADSDIKLLRSEIGGKSIFFKTPLNLPELVVKAVTPLMQSTLNSQVGLTDWERTYLEFRLPAWRSGRTAQGRPHLFDSEEAEQLYQPDLYVELDGLCQGWTKTKDGHPERQIEGKRKNIPEFAHNPRVVLSRWIGVEDLPRIALVGAPGGGKTIFLTRIAAVLAGACLGRSVLLSSSLDLERIRKNFRLPIPVVLEATKIAAQDTVVDARCLMKSLMDELSCGGGDAPQEAEIEREFRNGRYYLLIDALDEIADARLRSQVLTMLKGVAGAYPSARFLLTTRSSRYTGDLRFGPELHTVEVAPLSSMQVDELCTNWTVQRKQDSDYEISLTVAARGLSQSFVGTGNDQGLTENPLMLTAICMVFERYRSLPDDRGRLCELLVDDLCRSRRSEDVIRGWRLDENGKKGLLQRIAFSMQEEGAQTWPLDKAIHIARQLVPATESEPGLLAGKYVDWAADHTGILRFQEAKNDAEQIRFWHRIFREHLAATRIAQFDSTAGTMINDLYKKGRLYDPFWEDVIRLLPRALGTIEKANSVRSELEKLASLDPEHRGRLYGLAAAGIIENRDLFPEVRLAEMSRSMATLYEGEGHGWPEKDRLMFLEGLGRLDSVGGDPRLEQESWTPLPGPPVGAARLRLTGSKDPVIVPQAPSASYIATFPVTVKEFQVFAYGPDFFDPKLWEQMSPRVLRERDTLRDRVREQLAHPNWPVVSVGVGEAMAYCRWRSRQRTDGMHIRLPLSSEWRLLLKHAKLEPGKPNERGNTRSEVFRADFMHPYPVGAFPQILAGVSDAFGNIWEWCISTYIAGRKAKSPRQSFIVFGGGYKAQPQPNRINDADWFGTPPPILEYSGDDSIGFRCVLTKIPMNVSSTFFSRIN